MSRGCAAFLATRRRWLCSALHRGWNFAQGAVFSIAVSRQTGTGWLRGAASGPVLLTGGRFAAESSRLAVALCLAATAAPWCRARRRRPA